LLSKNILIFRMNKEEKKEKKKKEKRKKKRKILENDLKMW